MSAPRDRGPLRVVVCGTTFGQVYLEGLHRAGPEVQLAGILGRGSPRTVSCAEHYGVPLYDSATDLPEDIDVACVVVRSGLLGGSGTRIAQELMARGIHVIQEHPLHSDELADCLRAARSAGVVYQLNSFYPHVASVRRFIAAARELLRRQPAVYVDAACGFQLAFSLLDIVGRALSGVRPWALADPPGSSADAPFRSLEGIVGGVPMTLRTQNQMDPSDPDNHAHLDHRITIGTEGGNLTLVNTHGPIVLSQRPRYPREPRDPRSALHFAGEADDGTIGSATVIGPSETPGFMEIFATHWPPAVEHALDELRSAIDGAESPLRRGQHHLSVCALWQDIAVRMGPPDLVRQAMPSPLSPDALEAIVHAAEHLELAR